MPTIVTDDRALLDPGLGSFIAGVDAGGNLIKNHSEFVTYSFESDASAFDVTGESQAYVDSFRSVTESEKQEARDAFGQWGAASGLTFFEVPAGQGDIKIVKDNFALGGPYQSAAGYGGFGVLHVSDALGDGGLHLFLHEIGHNLGLKHPFDGDYILSSSDDNFAHTVMSYTSGGSQGTVLGSLDLTAISDLYGPASADGAQVSNWSWDAATDTLTQTGFSTSDTLSGVGGNNLLHGGDGDDVLQARASARGDFYGDAGNDKLSASRADTRLYGGLGADSLTTYLNAAPPSHLAAVLQDGGDGNDTLAVWGSGATSAASSIQLFGGGGLDDLSVTAGAASSIQLFGGDDPDNLSVTAEVGAPASASGGAGDDSVIGVLNPGTSLTLNGDDGSDQIIVTLEPPDGSGLACRFTVDGGNGADNLLLSQIASANDPIFISIPKMLGDGSSISNIESILLYGTSGNDVLVGSDVKAQIQGGEGDDVLIGGAANDSLFGGAGDGIDHDWMHGGSGDDYMIGGPQATADLAETRGATAVNVYGGYVVTSGPDGSDSIDGAGFIHFSDGLYAVSGGTLSQVAGLALAGTSGSDTLTGSAADDTLDGGGGDDTVVLAESFDVSGFGYSPGGIIRVSGPAGTDTLRSVEHLHFLDGTHDVGADGRVSAAAGRLQTAHAAGGALTGASGADTLNGADGNDTLTGAGASDLLSGGAGVDTAVYAGFAHDYALALNGGAGMVSGGPEGGTDTLASVENVRFLDGVLTFDTASTAAQIVRLYDSFLGRAPEVGGFDSYLRFVAQGHSFQDMADNAAASPEFHDATAALTDTQYVTYVYEHSLHREPDPGGLQNYLDALHSGTLTRTSMIVQAAESPEHVALTAGVVGQGLWVPDEKVESLELLYDAAVQRQPDPTGIAGYGALVASGTSYRQIANRMAGSAEFQAAHAGQDDRSYVDSLYVAEVGRHADPTGLAAYTDQLAHGYTRGDVLWETAFSQEHQSHVLAFYDPLLG